MDQSEEYPYGWICEPCYPNGVEIKILFDGLSLIYNEGKYHLLGGQGHRGDEILTFPISPYPDPYPQIMDDDIYKSYEPTQKQIEGSDQWLKDVEDNIVWKFSAQNGHWLVEGFTALGYDKNPTKEHRIFEHWVFNYLGKVIEDYCAGNSLS